MTTRTLPIGIAFATFFLAFSCGQNASFGQQPQWTGRVLKVGIDRQYTDSVDILERPYRPFHFYGNTVRRMHYRGFPLPLPVDFFMSGYAMMYERDLWFAETPEQPSDMDVNPMAQSDPGLAEYQADDASTEAVVSSPIPAENSRPSQSDDLENPVEFVSNIKNVDPTATSSATATTQPTSSSLRSSNEAKIILNSIEDLPFRDSVNCFKIMSVIDSKDEN